MNRNKKIVLKVITTLALVFAMVAGITAVFKGKAKASNQPGVYTVTFDGNIMVDGYKVAYIGEVQTRNGSWVTSYSMDIGAGANMGFPAARCGKYELLGYSTNKNAATPTYKVGDVIRAYGNTTFYAIWKPIDVHYYVAEVGCYPLNRYGYIYDANYDSIADSSGIDWREGGKAFFAGAKRVRLDKNNKYWTFTFKGWKAENKYGKWVDVTGLTLQQALNKIGYPDAREIYVTAIIDAKHKK